MRRPGFGRILLLKYIFPFAIILSLYWVIGSLDRVFNRNPDLQQEAIAYFQKRVELMSKSMKNEYWSFGEQEGASKEQVMLFFMEMSPAALEQLSELLNQLPPDTLDRLARILSLVELSPEVKQRLVAVLQQLLERGALTAETFKPIIEIFDAEKTKELQEQFAGIQLQKQSFDEQGQDGMAPGEEQPEGEEELITSEITEQKAAEAFVEVFTNVNVDNLEMFLEVLADLPPSLQVKVRYLFGLVAQSDAVKLSSVLNRLDTAQVRPVVNNMSRFQPFYIHVLTERFLFSDTGSVVKASDVMVRIDTPTAERLIDVSRSLDNNTFYSLIDIIDALPTSKARDLVKVGESLNNTRRFSSVISTLNRLDTNYKLKVIKVVSGISAGHVDKFLSTSNRMNAGYLKKGLDIVSSQTPQVTEQILDIWANLKSAGLNASVDVLFDVDAKHFRKAIDVTIDLKSNQQNSIFIQMNRVQDKLSRDDAGEPGKVNRDRRQRLQLLIGKLDLIDDDETTGELAESADGINDKALNQAVDVFLDLNIKRAKKAAKLYNRLDTTKREWAVDTLDNVQINHMKVAVDIVDEAHDNLLNDSVKYSNDLKRRLPKADAYETIERAINVASKVDTVEERYRGLQALTTQRAIQNQRILTQVDGQPDTFQRREIVQMTDNYLELDSGRRDKFADILSGSDGLIMGAEKVSGLSRKITQQRKIFRIQQYYSEVGDNRQRFDERFEYIARRPIYVPHDSEDDFALENPRWIKGHLGKPQSVNPLPNSVPQIKKAEID